MKKICYIFLVLLLAQPYLVFAKNESTFWGKFNIFGGKYVDLGLPSGTLWKSKNEKGFYDYTSAMEKFGNKLPTKEQMQELKDHCKWIWTGNGYKVVGKNNNFIVLPASGYRLTTNITDINSAGFYWSQTKNYSSSAWCFRFYSKNVVLEDNGCSAGHSIRLVKNHSK